jgi:hypothetical protein
MNASHIQIANGVTMVDSTNPELENTGEMLGEK